MSPSLPVLDSLIDGHKNTGDGTGVAMLVDESQKQSAGASKMQSVLVTTALKEFKSMNSLANRFLLKFIERLG